MAYLKCEIGKPLVLAIDKVTTEKGKFGMQTLFHAGDDSFAMSPDSAKKQLDFIGVSDPIDLTFEFSKVDIGNNRTAINIKQVQGHATSGPKKAQPFDQPAAPLTGGVDFTKLSTHPQARTGQDLYENITSYVLGTIVPLYDTAGVTMNAESVAACVATLYIQANKH